MNLANHSKETAFGRDSSWWGSSPALVAGGLTLALAAYGTWVLPRGLPAYYTKSLERAELAYQDSLDRSTTRNLANLDRTAGEVAVIHKRLISLERGEPARYWGLAEFQNKHANLLREKLDDAAASFLENEREELTSQAERYESQARDMLSLLASGESEFQLRAYLRLTRAAYQRGLQSYGVVSAQDRARAFAELLFDAASAASLPDDELSEAKLLLVRLQIEAAWQSQPGETLVLEPERMEQAQSWANEFLSTRVSADAAPDLRWAATEQLLSAYGTQTSSAPAADPTAVTRFEQGVALDVRPGPVWEWTLAEVELLAVKGAWSDIGFLLSSPQQSQDMTIRSSMGRTLCRLACSPKAKTDPDYASGFDLALELVYRAAPHVPEFAELIWDAADQHQRWEVSDTDIPAQDVSHPGKLAPAVVSAVLGGKSAVLKHAVLAISMAMQEKMTVARNHLQLILRSGGDLSIISRCILRQFQTGEETDTKLLETQRVLIEMVVELEPKGGLNWFALGNVQAALGNLDEAANSLEKSLELLGDVPAIKDMLSSIQRKIL